MFVRSQILKVLQKTDELHFLLKQDEAAVFSCSLTDSRAHVWPGSNLQSSDCEVNV